MVTFARTQPRIGAAADPPQHVLGRMRTYSRIQTFEKKENR
jgi:hypothetical protein